MIPPPPGPLTTPTPKKRRYSSTTDSSSYHHLLHPTLGGFNDSSSSDTLLRLSPDSSSPSSCDSDSHLLLHLHSSALLRSHYFSALLSHRWSPSPPPHKLSLLLPWTPSSIHSHLTALRLLYSTDFSAAVSSPSAAISLLPVALKLLFDDCVQFCIRFLESVPWSENEESAILDLIIPLLSHEESKNLLSRVSPSKSDSSEQMLDNLLLSAKQNHPNMAPVKAFVAKLLREFSSRDSARRVLEKAFLTSLKAVKESLEEYSSPDFRGDHNETEAIQRLNLHTALTNGKHLLWIVERMIELRVADVAVKEWSEQDLFIADLQRAFRDDAWRNIVPGLPTVVLKCTSKLASAVASGSILVDRKV